MEDENEEKSSHYLAPQALIVLTELLKLCHAFVDLLSKVVNYAGSVSQFRVLFAGPKGKPVFVPSAKGRAIGYELKALVEANYEFSPLYTHFRPRGHVGAFGCSSRKRCLWKSY